MDCYSYRRSILPFNFSVHRLWIEQSAERKERGDILAENVKSPVRMYYRRLGWDNAYRPRDETLLDNHLEWTAEERHAERASEIVLTGLVKPVGLSNLYSPGDYNA